MEALARVVERDARISYALLFGSVARAVDLVVLNDAPAAVAYRVFRDGVPLFVREPDLMAKRKARAILDYLDFRPLEQLAARGVLAAAARG